LNCAATGKISHATRWAARINLKAMRRGALSVDRMNVYRCKARGGLHIGYNAINRRRPHRRDSAPSSGAD